MKTLNVPRIIVADREKPEELSKKLDALPSYPIDTVNWKEYSYAPSVSFSIAHDENCLYLRYRVEEKCTMARVMEDNGAVWTDSCVEFFISFDDTGYYNFEFNCIGTALLAFRKEKPLAEHAESSVLKTILRYSSLPRVNFEEEKASDKNIWSLTVIIPRTAFFKHRFDSLNEVEAQANFYKCGDDLSMPHFLSWQPISATAPNFHLPEYFGKMKFE